MAGTKILIVDDEAGIREALSVMFEEKGYEVTAVDHGAAALEKASSMVFGAALIDIMLPDIPGTEVLKGLKRQQPDMVCCILTGHASLPNAIETLKDGAAEYFVKPVSIEEVLHRFEEALAKRQLQRQLKESEARYRSIFETAPNVILSLDRDGFVIDCNQRIQTVLGYTVEEIMGQPLSSLLRPEHRQVWDHSRNEILTRGSLYNQEYEMLHKDGGPVIVSVNAAAQGDKQGIYDGMICVVDDITGLCRAADEREHLHKQLQQAQKMEAIGTLAGGIAHDFNNILAAILGFSEMIRDDLPAESAARSGLEEVIKAGNRAKELVKQILAFSRHTQEELFPLQLQIVVKEAIKLLRASIPTTIKIRQSIDPNCGNVVADPTKIHQVMMNLCTNAYHAMRLKGGTLEVRLEPVSIDQAVAARTPGLRDGNFVRLTVSDTGNGMDEATLSRIFDPYFTTKPQGEGTGMGLFVVHGIVRDHGGAITVHSVLGKGTTFQIFFPVIEKTASVAEITSQAVPRGSEHILFVDDEESLVRLCHDMLERLGYKVTAVRSSVEAIELFRAGPAQFDLVITDQTMPDMTGIQLTRELLLLRPGLPVLLISGFSDSVTPELAEQTGVRAFLSKPLMVRELAQAIRDALGEKKAFVASTGVGR